MLWDIFCKVIDNHGDVGVCWRLAAELAARGEYVRLWADDPTALEWMAPSGHRQVQVVQWTDPPFITVPGDVVIEAFGCNPPDAFVAAMALKAQREGRQQPWINLEYLSAEDYVERSHGLPSPVMQGPGAGLVKQFFYPGFTARTGGLLRESDLGQRQARHNRDSWLTRHGVRAKPGTRVVSLFCYEQPALQQLVSWLMRGPQQSLLLVTAGKAQDEIRRIMPGTQRMGKLDLHFLPLLTQVDYDHLLWSCDLNFVRGEDSFVRALWAGKPFVWQIYPQEDGAHEAKLDAFMAWIGAGASQRSFHRVWNGLSQARLPAIDTEGWAPTAELARRRALALPELATGLMQLAGRPATI